MLLMFEKGIRGGITQAVHRYVKANNNHMDEKFDPKKGSSFLQYLDANNLYGWAMIQRLPTGGFKWINDVSRLPHLMRLVGLLSIITKAIFLRSMLNTQKNHMTRIMTSHLCVKR